MTPGLSWFQRWLSPSITRLGAQTPGLLDRSKIAKRVRAAAKQMTPAELAIFQNNLEHADVVNGAGENISAVEVRSCHISWFLYSGKLVKAAKKFRSVTGKDILAELVYSAEENGQSGFVEEEVTPLQHMAQTKASILIALRRHSNEKTACFEAILDEAVDLALEFNDEVSADKLLYRARKIADLGGNVIAAVVVLLQDIPPDILISLLAEKEGLEIYKLRDPIMNVLKNYHDLASFEFDLEGARHHRGYIETKMKELIRRSGYFETLLLFYFNNLQAVREISSKGDPLLDRVRFLLVPLAAKMRLVFLADDLRDQYLRVVNPEKYAWIEDNVVLPLTQFNYDQAKVYLRDFIDRLQHRLRQISPVLLSMVRAFLWRVKSPYSIWNKVEIRGRHTYDSLTDVLGVKIVTHELDELRSLAAIIKTEFNVADKDIEDNIKEERQTGFQALTMVVTTPSGRVIEIQFVTEEMDYHNTFLKAATWEYDFKKDLEELGFGQYFETPAVGFLNGAAEINFHRLHDHWAT